MACQLGEPVCLTLARYQFAGVINLDDGNAAPNSRSRSARLDPIEPFSDLISNALSGHSR